MMRGLKTFLTAICFWAAPFVSAAASDLSEVTVKRMFVDGPYGQVHVRIADPKEPSSKTPLILFHASPYSSHYFIPFINAMAKDRVVVAMDTPGYGDSDAPPAPPAISGYAASAAQALSELGYGADEQVDILGYHTGGLIAAELAIENPQLVRRLVLPGLPFLTGAARKSAYDEYAKPDDIVPDGSHLTEKWAFATYAMSVGVSLDRAQLHFNDMMQCQPNCWWSYHGVFSYESEKRLPEIRQPVLLISYDGSLSGETKAARKVIKNADHIHISGVTRGAFDVAVDELAEATRDFLDQPK